MKISLRRVSGMPGQGFRMGLGSGLFSVLAGDTQSSSQRPTLRGPNLRVIG